MGVLADRWISRFDQAEAAHAAVVLDDQHLRHDHELQQHEREGDVAAGEVEAREGEAGEGAQYELRGEDLGDRRARTAGANLKPASAGFSS
jgi:hypothetical protein